MNIKEYKKSVSSSAPLRQESGWTIGSLLNYDIRIFAPKFGEKSKETFYLELSTLFSAGLDLKTSLEILIAEQSKKSDKQMLSDVLDNVVRGAPFSESLRKTGQFSPYEFFSIQIGEESGKLAAVLNQLSAFYTNKLKQRRKIVSALSYPMIILTTAIAAVAFMLGFVVPMFRDIFSRFGGDLPPLTKAIIAFSEYVQEYFFPLMIIVLLIAIAIWYAMRFEQGKRIFTSIVVGLPLVGSLIKTVYLGRFSSSMALLISARVPMLSAIALIRKMIPFYPIRDSLAVVEKEILTGESLYTSLSKFQIYDKKMLSLIKVGEEVNRLDFFFEQLSQKYLQEVEYKTSLIGTFLEPVIIIFLGVIVAFILIAMYLPMFQMSNQIGV